MEVSVADAGECTLKLDHLVDKVKAGRNVIKLMSTTTKFNKAENRQKELRTSKYHILYAMKMFLSQFNTSRRSSQANEHIY